MADEPAAAKKRSPKPTFSWFEDEIVHLVIAPKILPLIQSGEYPTKAAVLTAFNEAHGSEVSASAFSKWLDLLGIETQRVQTFKLPDHLRAQPAEAPAQVQRGQELPDGITQTGGDVPRPGARPQVIPGVGGVPGAR